MKVHQIVPYLGSGEPISSQALAIDEVLRSWGVASQIYAYNMDDFGRQHAVYDSEYRKVMHEGEGDILIYHYALFCENYRLFVESRHRKVLVYHNITPEGFYKDYHFGSFFLCRLGRQYLRELGEYDLALADSEYNRRELLGMGFEEEKSAVLPIYPPLDYLEEAEEDPLLARSLNDGKTNLLSVGRVVPNKRIEDVIKLFACYHHGVNATSRLIVAGFMLYTYYEALISLVRRLGLEGRVHFLGRVSDAQLKACYRGCQYYISMSEHEGFSTPLLESFHFGLVVLAYDAGAVPETMGGAGVLFAEKEYPLMAELLDRLERDTLLRERVIAAQRERLGDFSRENFTRNLARVLAELLPLPEGVGN